VPAPPSAAAAARAMARLADDTAEAMAAMSEGGRQASRSDLEMAPVSTLPMRTSASCSAVRAARRARSRAKEPREWSVDGGGGGGGGGGGSGNRGAAAAATLKGRSG